jgi:hypothetical protein
MGAFQSVLNARHRKPESLSRGTRHAICRAYPRCTDLARLYSIGTARTRDPALGDAHAFGTDHIDYKVSRVMMTYDTLCDDQTQLLKI